MQILQEINPYLRIAMYSTLKGPFQIGPRILFDYELIYIQKGSWKLTFLEQTRICGPGDVLLFCPGQRHTLESQEDVLQPHIHFDLVWDQNSPAVPISFRDLPEFSPAERKLIRPNLLESQLLHSPILKISDLTRFEQLFFDVIDHYQKLPVDSLALKAKTLLLLNELFEDNLSPSPPSQPASHSLLSSVKNYIDQNCAAVITLDHLAAFFHYNKYYIAKQFQRQYGYSPIAYYHHQKINRAKELLKAGISVSQVSDTLSFSSIYAFSRFFKQQTGQSPTQYQKDCSSIK
ncbi:MAG: AraC family transcriptional regulator [Massiliimalia sp.]|jgi:AraC-like DNA-binding protein